MAYPHDKRYSPKPLARHVRCGVLSYRILKNSSSLSGLFGSKKERTKRTSYPGNLALLQTCRPSKFLLYGNGFSATRWI